MALYFLTPLEVCSRPVPITSEASKSFVFLSPAEAECGRSTEQPSGCPCPDSPRLVNETRGKLNLLFWGSQRFIFCGSVYLHIPYTWNGSLRYLTNFSGSLSHFLDLNLGMMWLVVGDGLFSSPTLMVCSRYGDGSFDLVLLYAWGHLCCRTIC